MVWVCVYTTDGYVFPGNEFGLRLACGLRFAYDLELAHDFRLLAQFWFIDLVLKLGMRIF